MKEPTGKPFGTNTHYVLVPLTRGLVTAVSPADKEWIKKNYWYAGPDKNETFYATRRGKGTGKTRIKLHRQIAGDPPDLQVDHINGYTLDNRRCNLRLATHKQQTHNQRKPQKNNTSKYIGVYRSTRHKTKPYVALINIAGKQKNLGYFKTAREAARVRDKMARKVYGKFARLNFPVKNEKPPRPPSRIMKQKPTKPLRNAASNRGHCNRISKFAGVSSYGSYGKFEFRIQYKGKLIRQHGFTSEENAAHARDEIIKEMGWPHPLAFPNK